MLTGTPCNELLPCDETFPCNDGPVAIAARVLGGRLFCSDTDPLVRCSNFDVALQCADGITAKAA